MTFLKSAPLQLRQHHQIAGTSCQVFDTALGPKGLPSGTIGKLVGMVRIQTIGKIRSQVLTLSRYSYGCSSETEWWWASCLCEMPKIQSVPLETELVRGIHYGCHPRVKESLRGIVVAMWRPRWPIPTKKFYDIYTSYFLRLFKYYGCCLSEIQQPKLT
jgi:hypothetical protein